MKIKVKIIPDDGPVEVYEFDSYREAVNGLILKANPPKVDKSTSATTQTLDMRNELSTPQETQSWIKKLFSID